MKGQSSGDDDANDEDDEMTSEQFTLNMRKPKRKSTIVLELPENPQNIDESAIWRTVCISLFAREGVSLEPYKKKV